MLTQEVTEDDIEQICKLAETREELFYCFPRAAFPLSVADVRHSIQRVQVQLWLKKKGMLLPLQIFIAGKKAYARLAMSLFHLTAGAPV